MAVLVRTRRLSNPSVRRTKKKGVRYTKAYGSAYSKVRLGSKRPTKARGYRRKKNPSKKMSLAQKLHFGTARQRAAARLRLRNPSIRRTKKALKRSGKAKLGYVYTPHITSRSGPLKPRRKFKARRKNVGEIVSLSLAGLNPGRKRRATSMARRRRRNAGTRAGRSWSTYTKSAGRKRRGNPGRRRRATSHRRRRTGGTSVAIRRRRRNPTFRIRRVRRHRNPGIGPITTGLVGKAFAVIGGAVASKYVTQLALGGNNTGYMGYAGNLVSAIGLGWAASKITKSKDIGMSVTIGGVVALALRMLQDMTSIGQYVNLSLAGAGKGGDLGLGIIQDSSFPVPQTFAPGSMTSGIVPRATRGYVASAVSAATAQTAQMKATGSGMGRMNGRVARRAIV